jgi:hypothetical protein
MESLSRPWHSVTLSASEGLPGQGSHDGETCPPLAGELRAPAGGLRMTAARGEVSIGALRACIKTHCRLGEL